MHEKSESNRAFRHSGRNVCPKVILEGTRFKHQKYDFQRLEDRLNALGFRLVFCYRRPETFIEARRERLKISGNPSQYDDLARIVREQEMLFDAFRNSKLDKLMIDVTERTVASLAEEITAWLEKSGALYGDEVTEPASIPLAIGIKRMVVAGSSRGMGAASTSRNH